MTESLLSRDYAVHFETLATGVERLQSGAPVEHRVKLDLAPGVWMLQATVTAGLANVSAQVRLAHPERGGRLLGGTHNGAMSPYFSPAAIVAIVDGAIARSHAPVELLISFEPVGPNAIPVLGQRTLSVIAFRRPEAPVAARPAPQPKVEPAVEAKVEAPAVKQPAPVAKAAPKKAASPPPARKKAASAPARPAQPRRKPAAKTAQPKKKATAQPKPAPAKRAPAKPAKKPATAGRRK